jgi:hypothetical protein
MKAIAILNNYQLGSYPYKVMSNKIIKETRLDKSHTQITWDNLSKNDFELLKKLIRNIKEC